MKKAIVLGLGNVLYGDEGFGVRLAERLDQHHTFTPELEIVDGGTRGLALLPYIEQADSMLVLDAVDMALSPGASVILEGEAIPRWLVTRKLSLHQTSFAELLALAAFRNTLPHKLILLGVQPADLTYGAPLSARLERQLPALEEQCLALLRRLGHKARTAKPYAPVPNPHSTLPALLCNTALCEIKTSLPPACPFFWIDDGEPLGEAYGQAAHQYPLAERQVRESSAFSNKFPGQSKHQ